MKKRSLVDGKSSSPEQEQLSVDIDALFNMTEPLDPAPESTARVAQPAPTGQLFGSAAGGGRPELPPMPELQRGFDEIVRDLFEGGLDVRAEYDQIRRSLSIDGGLTPTAIQAAANNAEGMADRAFRLYVVGVNEYQAYMRDIEIVEAALRDAATAQLEMEKANGSRKKQITEADVSATIAQIHPDEWDDVQRRKTMAKGMLDYLANLHGLARSRCFSISKMQRGDNF